MKQLRIAAGAMTAICLAGVFGTRAPAIAQGRPKHHGRYVRAEKPIPNQYIVRLRDDDPAITATAAVEALAARHGGRVAHRFAALGAFVTNLTDADARALADDPAVLYVEEDGYMHAAATQASPTWGLDRIDQRSLPLNATYTTKYTGAGVNAYVIDSGIRFTHADFGGRAAAAFDAYDDGRNGNDCYGHGTHVAGTIGSKTYGVAKAARLFSVRVLDCNGNGAVSTIITGIDWVTSHHAKPAVANMSIAGGDSPAMRDAIRRSVLAGVTYVVAAGNNSTDACDGSPANAVDAITVAATNNLDRRSSFSNFGACVDIFGPGESIRSTYFQSDTSVTTMSGTSMAAPHVAGVAALYLEANRFSSPEGVAAALLKKATSGAIADPGAGSPNLLVYAGAAVVSVDQSAPAVQITAPSPGATVVGARTMTVAATDNSVITRVNFFVDQNLVATRTKLPYSISMDTSALTNGSHRLIASALDSSGNVGWSPEQTMVVANPGRTSYDPVLKTIVCGGAAAECDSGISLAGRGPIGPEPNAPNTINNSCADGEGGTYGADESLNRLRVFTVDGGKLTAGKPVTIEATVHAFSMTDDSLDLFAAPNARSPVWTRIGTWKPPALGDVTMTASYVLPAGTLQAIRGVFRYQGASGTCSKGVYDDADDLVFSVESAATSTTTAILLSGGFEPTVKGWGKTGAAYFSTGGVEHSGSGYGYLAKANAVSGTIFQDVTIPAGTSPVLSFWLNVTSDEPSATIASDKLKVELLNTSGAVLATLATYSNLDKTAAGVYVAKGGFALGAYAGETVRLQFRASTNAANVTAFRIDDVAIATPGPERITSGGFEPTVSGWAKSGAGYFSKGGVEHTGIGYAYLAKGNSLRGTLSQQMVIPAGTAPVLSFWLNVTSEESAASPGADRLFVEVLNPSGAVLATLDTFSSVDKHDAGSYVLESGYSLAPFAGQTVTLQFRAVTDATLISAYRIDDVSVR